MESTTQGGFTHRAIKVQYAVRVEHQFIGTRLSPDGVLFGHEVMQAFVPVISVLWLGEVGEQTMSILCHVPQTYGDCARVRLGVFADIGSDVDEELTSFFYGRDFSHIFLPCP